MSAKTTQSRLPLTMIAKEALDFVRYGKDQARWLAALMKSIQLYLEHSNGTGVKDLADLGRYLGEDCANYLDCHAEELGSQLDAAEGTV